MEYPKRFFRRIFRDILEKHDLDLELRCLHADLPPEQIWCYGLEQLEHVWPQIERLNTRHFDVHFTVVPRLRKYQGKKEHPLPDDIWINGLWADQDVGPGKPFKNIAEALKRVRDLGPVPSIIVESGTGIHPYYMFEKPHKVSRKRLEAVLGALTERLDGDAGAARASRLMRVPNTLNWKNTKNPKVAKARYFSREGHHLRDLEALWKVEAVAEQTRKDGNRMPDSEPAAVENADYFDLFSPHVGKLKRSGEFARGLCPFHDDHNPSFSVNIHTGRWVCFACGREGSWSQFRKEGCVDAADVLTNHKQTATSPLDWQNLPRFDPTKAPKTKWLVEDFIPERGITVLVGESGTFKSTFTLLMCDAVCKGTEFLDRGTRKRRVLYLDNENPPDVLKNRNNNMKLKMEANKRLRLWTMYDERPIPKIGSRELREIVRRSTAEGRRVLIVLDHLSSFLSPGDGGEVTGQTAPLFQELKRLCALGATIVILHHSKKYDVGTYYGSADIKAKCDAMHTFVLHENKLHSDRPIIRIACFLKRHGGQSAFALEPHVSDGEVVGFNVVEDPAKVEKKRKRDLLRDMIRQHPRMPQHALIKMVQERGLSRDELRSLCSPELS